MADQTIKEQTQVFSPNNFGPFLIVVLGLLLSPTVVGLPVLLYGFSRIRNFNGKRDLWYLFP